MRAGTAALAAALALAGCATNRVTLLDNEDGAAQFAVADITRPGKERVIDQPNEELRLGRSGPGKVLKKPRDSDVALARAIPAKAFRQDFLFAPQVSQLTPDQLAQLDAIREAAKERAPAKIEIEGFTDTDGDEAMNLDLSRQRAAAVAAQLRAAGLEIADDDIVARGEYEAAKIDPPGKVNPDFRKVTVIVR